MRSTHTIPAVEREHLLLEGIHFEELVWQCSLEEYGLYATSFLMRETRGVRGRVFYERYHDLGGDHRLIRGHTWLHQHMVGFSAPRLSISEAAQDSDDDDPDGEKEDVPGVAPGGLGGAGGSGVGGGVPTDIPASQTAQGGAQGVPSGVGGSGGGLGGSGIPTDIPFSQGDTHRDPGVYYPATSGLQQSQQHAGPSPARSVPWTDASHLMFDFSEFPTPSPGHRFRGGPTIRESGSQQPTQIPTSVPESTDPLGKGKDPAVERVGTSDEDETFRVPPPAPIGEASTSVPPVPLPLFPRSLQYAGSQQYLIPDAPIPEEVATFLSSRPSDEVLPVRFGDLQELYRTYYRDRAFLDYAFGRHMTTLVPEYEQVLNLGRRSAPAVSGSSSRHSRSRASGSRAVSSHRATSSRFRPPSPRRDPPDTDVEPSQKRARED